MTRQSAAAALDGRRAVWHVDVWRFAAALEKNEQGIREIRLEGRLQPGAGRAAMTQERYELRAWWNSRPLTVPQCAEQFRAFVNALAEFDPVFSSWLRSSGASANACFSVPLGAEEALQFVMKARARYDSPPDRLWPEMGYRVFGWNGGPPEYRGRRAFMGGASLQVGAFGRDQAHRNYIILNISETRIGAKAPWTASELRPLMKLVLSIWAPRELSVDCQRYDAFVPEVEDKANATGSRRLLPWVGWLTYLPADLAAKVAIPPDIGVERLDDGGIIATLCEEPFTIDDPVHMARARAMEAAIRPVQA
jgi:hypothetical protein